MGFAFDGDSDRVIAVDENGDVVDGDKIIYLFAMHYKKHGKLIPAVVVGTRHTNMGVEMALKEKGVDLIRTDIGDKYVGAKLDEKALLIGGEQSGHVFVKDKLQTGDGILNALLIAEICKTENKKLSQFFDFKPYKQVNLNVEVADKMRVINSQKLADAEKKEMEMLKDSGRIMIRVSGTEPFIRIMVETQNEKSSAEIAKRLAGVVEMLEKESC
jgi:phosphoglucosamine mutase